jgi:ABC-type nickel/cobalt efflux system permease component RcnA
MADHAHDDDHSHGLMDIRDHERTFERFVRMVAWGIGISIGILIFLALANS